MTKNGVPLSEQEVFELVLVKRIEIHRLMLTLPDKAKERVLERMKNTKIGGNEPTGNTNGKGIH